MKHLARHACDVDAAGCAHGHDEAYRQQLRMLGEQCSQALRVRRPPARLPCKMSGARLLSQLHQAAVASAACSPGTARCSAAGQDMQLGLQIQMGNLLTARLAASGHHHWLTAHLTPEFQDYPQHHLSLHTSHMTAVVYHPSGPHLACMRMVDSSSLSLCPGRSFLFWYT